jgi:hypothetical protein
MDWCVRGGCLDDSADGCGEEALPSVWDHASNFFLHIHGHAFLADRIEGMHFAFRYVLENGMGDGSSRSARVILLGIEKQTRYHKVQPLHIRIPDWRLPQATP